MFKSRDSIPFALIPYGSFTFHCTSTRVLSAASLNTVIFKTQAFLLLLLLLFSPNRPVSYIFRNIAEVRHTATSEYSLFPHTSHFFKGCSLPCAHWCCSMIASLWSYFELKDHLKLGFTPPGFASELAPPDTEIINTSVIPQECRFMLHLYLLYSVLTDLFGS